MKIYPIRWNVPGAKCCVHENGMTAIVSESDSVHIYEGGRGEPLRMFVFFPRTAQSIYVNGDGKERNLTARELECVGDAKRIYDKGLQLLAAARYSPFHLEDGKIYDWLKSLSNRPCIPPEELKKGHRLIASVWKFSRNYYALSCMLGDYRSLDSQGNPIFQIENDPVLGNGIWVSAEYCHDSDRVEIKGEESLVTVKTVGCSPDSHNVELTGEDAKFMRELIKPFPAQQFLCLHREMLETVKEKREERGRAIRRAASCAGGNLGPGTVRI